MNDQAFQLRTNGGVRAERIPAHLRCIAVGSGKGGVGKTMISVGLACYLAKMKFRVLLFDADLGLANVDLQMGIDPKFTLQDVIFGNCTLEDAVISYSHDGPDILAAASGAPEMVDMGAARRQMLVDDLVTFAANYDYLVIDVGAGIGKGVTTFLGAAPEVAIVVANEPTSIMDAYSLIKVLSKAEHSPSLMLVINQVETIEEGERLAQKLNIIMRKHLGVELPVAGIVIRDPVVGDAIRAGTPVPFYAENSAVTRCLAEVARFLAFGLQAARRITPVDKPFFDRLAGVGIPEPAKAEGA